MRTLDARSRARSAASLVVADPLMRSLGRPNREQVVTTRPDDLTTLQALDLTNGDILADLLDAGGPEPLARASRTGRPTRCRLDLPVPPSAAQPAAGRGTTGPRRSSASPSPTRGLADLLWIVFMLPEFQMIR